MEGMAFVLYNSNMRASQSKSAIQVYNLFGEQGDLPDVVHCDTIVSRAALHDWKLSLHRHARLHQILLIERGGGTIVMIASLGALAAGPESAVYTTAKTAILGLVRSIAVESGSCGSRDVHPYVVGQPRHAGVAAASERPALSAARLNT